MDLKDRKILAELWKNARSPYSVIAKNVGLSREVVEYRVKSLEKAGIIKYYITLVDNNYFGATAYFIGLRLKNIDKTNIISLLKDSPCVKWIVTCSGDWDMILIVTTKDASQLEDFLSQLVEKTGNTITNFNVSIRSKILKDADIVSQNSVEETLIKKIAKKSSFQIDETDIIILRELKQDARKQCIDLAKKASLTPEAVSRRIKNLMKENIIRGFRPHIDVHKLDLLWFMLLVKTKPLTSKEEKSLQTFFNTRKNIYYVENIIGEENLKIEIVAKDHYQFAEEINAIKGFLGDKLFSHKIIVLFDEIMQSSFTESMIR